MSFSFEVQATSGLARAGALATERGQVATPCFMPVATQASVKALAPDEVASTGARMVIMNTYHLWLRPGAEVVEALGGLHRFSGWPHLIATDSGGFQAFSLAERTRVTEEGVQFASHLDGSRKLLTPEESMRVQGQLGSDIAMQLDICPPGGSSQSVLAEACARTTRWGRRCLASVRPGQALFGIVQGGTDLELRLSHARELAELQSQGRSFDGLALGGFSVGEPPLEMWRALEQVAPVLDARRPRYLMGVGTPADIVHAVGCGVDLFDCVLPTRNARNGTVFTSLGKLNIKNGRHRLDGSVLDPACPCPACTGGYSRATLRHLFVAGEILALRLLSHHNIFFYQSLVAEARQAIVDGSFRPWAERWLTVLGGPAPAPKRR